MDKIASGITPQLIRGMIRRFQLRSACRDWLDVFALQG